MKWIILTRSSSVMIKMMMVSVLIMAVGANNITGNWFECPVTIVTYPGCNVSVHAYFEAFLVPPHESVDCSQNFKLTLFLNDVKQPDPIVTVINNTEDGGNICRVVGQIAAVPVGDNDVKFRAQYIGTDFEAVTLECDDHIRAEVPHPTINEPIITCDGVLVKWAEHPSVNDSNHGDILYSLVVMETSLSYSTSNTSVLIPYSDGLEYDTLYTVQLSSVYCGNQGNVTNTTLYTAMAPNVTIDNDGSAAIHRTNSTHGHITSTVKMSRDDCIVSHPKTVTTNMNCTSSLVHEGGPEERVTDKPVTVRHDYSIKVDTIVPVDNRCTVGLTFNNGELSTSIDPFNINTNQLRTCTFNPKNDGITFTCIYLYTPTTSDLWGCRVELMTSNLTMILNTIDVPVAQGHDLFDHLCNDVYALRCYGLRYNPHNDSTQPLSYDNSSDHTHTVTVTAGDTSCTTSSSGITATSTRSSSTPMVSPSTNPSSTKSVPMEIFVIVIVAILAVLIVVIVISVVFCIFRKKLKRLFSPSPSESDPIATGYIPPPITTVPETENPAFQDNEESVKGGDSYVVPPLNTSKQSTTASNGTENGQLAVTNPSINGGRGSMEAAYGPEEEGTSDRTHKNSLKPESYPHITNKRHSAVFDETRRDSDQSIISFSMMKRVVRRGSDFVKNNVKPMVMESSSRGTMESDNSEKNLMYSSSVPPSTEVASDDFHNPPADTRSGLGGDTFVSGISTRTRSDTVGSGPLLSPKIELKSDERNLLSYEDNNDDEDDIDIDDKFVKPHPSVPPPSGNQKLKSTDASTTDSSSQGTTESSVNTQSNESCKDGESSTNEVGDSRSSNKEQSTDPSKPSSNENLDTNTSKKTNIPSTTITDSSNNTNPSNTADPLPPPSLADSSNTAESESPPDREPSSTVAEPSSNGTTQVSNANDSDDPLPSAPMPKSESQCSVHTPIQASNDDESQTRKHEKLVPTVSAGRQN